MGIKDSAKTALSRVLFCIICKKLSPQARNIYVVQELSPARRTFTTHKPKVWEPLIHSFIGALTQIPKQRAASPPHAVYMMLHSLSCCAEPRKAYSRRDMIIMLDEKYIPFAYHDMALSLYGYTCDAPVLCVGQICIARSFLCLLVFVKTDRPQTL